MALEQASTCLEVLQEAQATGPSTGFALQIFSKGAKHCDLSQADHSLVVEDCQTLFAASSTES